MRKFPQERSCHEIKIYMLLSGQTGEVTGEINESCFLGLLLFSDLVV